MSRRTTRDLAILSLVTLALLAPFIDKALHVDDPLFVRMAEQIARDPARPYNFEVSWDGFAEPAWMGIKNPPLISYLQAPLVAAFDAPEVPLHILHLSIALVCAWMMYGLSSQFTERPLWPALFLVVSPAFAVSATSVMCDVPAMTFWLAATWLLVGGCERESAGQLVLSGVMIALAMMTKYTSLLLLPLVIGCAVIMRQWKWRMIWPLAIPIAVLLAWRAYAKSQFGIDHVLDGAGFVAGRWQVSLLAQCVAGIVFAGGCTVFPLLAVRYGLRLRGVLLSAAIALPFPIASLLLNEAPAAHRALGNQVWIAALSFIFAAAAVGLLLASLRDMTRRRLFLLVWYALALLAAMRLFWTASGRIVLLLAPAAAILTAMVLERRRVARGVCIAAVCCVGVLSLLLNAADREFANGHRDLARSTVERYAAEGRPVFFAAHWGWQYYAEKAGARSVSAQDDAGQWLTADAVVVQPFFSSGRGHLDRARPRLKLTRDDWHASSWPIRTIHPVRGACFYAHLLNGLVPYVPTTDAMEIVLIYEPAASP